ncbi:hypothetical protein HHK36_001956 [Tetracentron sinense]|uniref:Aspergillus nuclease S1 n=1 Tax=Tetracentron sinense TaxID=13715 RepID=A0A835DV85_TETSI|nr:hypothetical protein HHK36_001956 [Tetracentron sinense]
MVSLCYMVVSDMFWIWRALVLFQLLPGILAWGKEGHYAICKIAEGFLTEDAAAAVKVLLPEYAEGDLAAVCSWADEIRFHLHWSGPLHYVDTPDFRCNYEYCRDCHDSAQHKDRCVTGAIYNYTMQLMDYHDSDSQWKYNLTEALMFLSHFIGDVHQPLHVGYIGDEGGNTITVRWYRRKTNLHHVWDTMIIESALKEFYGKNLSVMIQAIQRNITDGWSSDITSWENCASDHMVCPNPYASESISLACKFAYRNATPGSTLADDYFLSRLPVVERRLAQSGALLEPAAAEAVHNLLPDYVKGDLSALCTWPDQIRHWYKYRWTSSLHFIDTPDEACTFDYSRDCHDPHGSKDMCVAGAVQNFTSQLLHYREGSSDRRYNLTEALLFLSHFMGDIHQPLHVGFTSDEGGNTIQLRWFKHKSNLHHVWDREIILTAAAEMYGKDMELFQEDIQRNLTHGMWSDEISSWRDCDDLLSCAKKYAAESINLACKWGYKDVTPSETLGGK